MLMKIGERDLKSEIEKTGQLLMQRPVPFERIDYALHALKGLLTNMSNQEAAQKMSEFRSRIKEDRDAAVDEMKKYFTAF